MKFNKTSLLVFGSMLVFTFSCESSTQGNSKDVKVLEDKKHDYVAEKNQDINEGFSVDGYKFYGNKKVTLKEAVTVQEMINQVNTQKSFQGVVAAKLSGVCKKMGCWVTLENGENPIRVRFKDHAFFVPTDTPEGTSAVLVGSAKIDTISVDLQKHYLDDAKEAGKEIAQEEYDAITEDLIEISFISDGILVKNNL